MKKNILLLLVSALLSFGTAQAATDHVTCYGKSIKFTATKTGTYQWYKNGVKINGATGKDYTETNPTANAKYTCEITTAGSTASTGNLISLGNFEFNNESQYKRYKQHITDPVRGDSYDIEYQLDQLNLNNQANSGEYCTSTNPNNIKPQYFSSITAKEGSKMLVVDGAASSNEFTVFHVRELKLKGGVTYQFSCFAANIDKEYFTKNHGTNSLPKIKFVIEADGHGKQVLGGGYMTLTDELGVWKEYKATFTPSNDCNWAHITIINTTNTTVAGNDFVLDGIYFGAERTTASNTQKEEFNLTVYDTFEYDFKTEEVCPGAQATITTTLVPAHGGTLEPAANYKYEWKLNGTTPVVSTNKDLQVTAPSTVGTESYVISTSSTVCYNSGAKSETTSVKTKDCGNTETIDHPAIYSCPGERVTLQCDHTGDVEWTEFNMYPENNIIVDASSNVDDTDTYTCKITTKVNGNTIVYIEKFTVITKKCEETYPSTICNTNSDSTLTATIVGDIYEWKGTDVFVHSDIKTLRVNGTEYKVGDIIKLQCKIWKRQYSPNTGLPNALPDIYLGTEYFEIEVTNCNTKTEAEEELQVEEDGSIKLVIPSENRCTDCTYNWFKKDENGEKGEPVIKNPGEEAWEHTVYNATEEEFICEIIAPNGNKHEQSYTLKVYKPETTTYCYSAESNEEQKSTITLTEGDKDEYEWYWKKDNALIPFPEGSITTDNNNITLDVAYFVENSNSKYPVNVHIVEKYAHKLQVESTEIKGGNNSTDVTPEPEPTPETPIAPAPDPVAPAAIPPIQINTSALSISSLNIINGGKSYSYEHTFEDASTSTVNIEIGQDYQYTEYFASKVGGMTEHAGVVRLTNTGINGCHAYKGDDPNNEYFFEVDGGDKAGPIFSIVQEGKIIKGKKYILRFLARETSTDPSISGPTTNPAKIDFKITLNGNTYGVTNQIEINKQDWTAHVFNYIANEDADNVILTLSNYNTDSGHNDFAIDEITFALADPSIAPENRSLKFRNLADENEGIVDEDGDGFVMWKNEHILVIYPNTTQRITEASSPNLEYEKEVILTNGEKIKFNYYPSMYEEGMTKYETNDYRTDEYGCQHHVYLTLNLVVITPDIYFTPNGDGVNDKWMVEGIESAPNAHIMIYDRHSKLLYKSIASEFEGWDGNYNGHGMVQDDYWYVILIPETNETLSGHFTLKR